MSHPFNELRLRRLIRERIRQETNKKFNWNEFLRLSEQCRGVDDINNLDVLNQYASERLRLLGEGSSRATYTLTSRSVLKIAIGFNRRGATEQNEFEVAKFNKLKNLPAITKIFKYDEKYFQWIVAELVNPINESEFNEMMPVDKSDKRGWVSKLRRMIDDPGEDDPFIEIIRPLVRSDVITNVSESLYYDQWGKNVDGELRLLDYGW